MKTQMHELPLQALDPLRKSIHDHLTASFEKNYHHDKHAETQKVFIATRQNKSSV